MLNTLRSFWKRFHPQPVSNGHAALVFKDTYRHFRNLLESNSELLQIVAGLQLALEGETIFGMAYLRSQAARAMFHASRIVFSINAMSGGQHQGLQAPLERIRSQIDDILSVVKVQPDAPLVLPLTGITREDVDFVGGKNANLGEMAGRLGLPVPRGFAVSTTAYSRILSENHLMEDVRAIAMELSPEASAINRGSEALQKLLLEAPLPADVTHALEKAWDDVFGTTGVESVALRSSAIGEDSELTFAGQYLSVLNVTRERFMRSYSMVLASLFTARALAYRLYKGVPIEDASMSVVCLEMVDALASGVVYSCKPMEISREQVLVTAVWGLGPYAVDGRVSPDSWTVKRGLPLEIEERRITRKTVQLLPRTDGGVEERPVPVMQQEVPCLEPSQVLELAQYAITLEEHYGCPQDVEWALDRQGRLLLLQTRPLHAAAGLVKEQTGVRPDEKPPATVLPSYKGHALLLSGGETANPGAGSGPVHLVLRDEDLEAFPDGGVLVARHSSPRYVVVLPRATAVVAETGSVTGHMASLVREFRVPALFNLRGAATTLQQGDLVTVDARSGRVFSGTVRELLQEEARRYSPGKGVMRGTPVYAQLERLARLIVPLTLTDPKSPNFTPGHCASLHDIMRYAHEHSYTEMFRINDATSQYGELTTRLFSPLPIDLYLIDLGGGVSPKAAALRKVGVDDIMGSPFKSLLQGMLEVCEKAQGPRPVHLDGFFSVLAQQMLQPPNLAMERFGERSYALISDKYCNFSSRVGYHYGILDSYCGETTSKNYIHFEFKGGAADDVRRNRRAKAIAMILETLDFEVEAVGDRVVARYRRHGASETLDRLQALGRLLIFTRQMDMLMNSESSVELAVKCFINGCCDLSEGLRAQ